MSLAKKNEKPYAEDLGHYWKTSNSSPDSWLEKAVKEINRAGGLVTAQGYVLTPEESCYMIQFEFGKDKFKILWPVLESKTKNTIAAKRQAATMLYHDVKARCVSAKVLGARQSFYGFMLPGSAVRSTPLLEA